MVCLYCGYKTKITNSRKQAGTASTWRRHQCLDCGAIFTTREIIDLESALRVQAPDGLRPFIRDRLFVSIHLSVSHRKTALNDSKELTDTIIKQLLPLQSNGVLQINHIIKTTQLVLSNFDAIAAAVYGARHS